MTAKTPAPERRWERRGRRRSARATLALLGGIIVLLVGLLIGVAWLPVKHAADAYREGRVAQSIIEAERWAGRILWERQFDQILAAAYLTAGKPQAAEPHLAALRETVLWVPALPKALVAERLFARDRYAEFLAYDSASRERREEAGVALDRAGAQVATNRLAEAGATLARVDRGKVDATRLSAVEAALQARRSGVYPLLLSRDGRTIASYQIANKDLVAVDTQFAPLLEKEAGQLTVESQLGRIGVDQTITTTLDPVVQSAAIAALGGFRGSLVAIDPKTNEILAVASTRGTGPLANLAFERQYEPGSVMKLLTGLNALASGVDVGSMFPYDCKGELLIDGRHFGDWLPGGHGVLPRLDDAFAESCNVVFADIGLRLGTDRLLRFMNAAGFDGSAGLGLYDVPLGRILPPIDNRFETAFLAIGLQHESIDTIHLAMLASMAANRGALAMPRLVRERRSVIGDVLPAPPPRPPLQLAPREAAEAMVRAMEAVVTRPHGTGHRAAVEGIPIAMKTGTAGDRTKGGLQALILAFAPADHPKIAFGMIAEDAGPAEFAGAKITHDFVEALRPRLQ